MRISRPPITAAATRPPVQLEACLATSGRGGIAVGPLGVFWTITSRGEVHFLAR